MSVPRAGRSCRMQAFALILLSVACHAQRVDKSMNVSLATPVMRFPGSAVGTACLGRTGDSTMFTVDIIADSARPGSAGILQVDLVPRRALAGTSYENVSARLQLNPGGTSYGEACWKDSGIVFRGMATFLREAAVTLDAGDKVRIRVITAAKELLGDTVIVGPGPLRKQLEWGPPI